jgi:penicillin-binding protein 1A
VPAEEQRPPVTTRKKRMKRDRFFGGFLSFMLAGLPLLVLCGLITGGLGGLLGAYFRFAKDLPDIPDLRRYRPKTVSTFYAEDGTVIGIFYKEKRFPVPLDSIPPHVVNAFLAAEDVRFFSHAGVDPLGILRAAYQNFKSGRWEQGGSTITQQLTRNFLLSREKTLERKIREAILAYRLEKTLSKKELLGLYLNEVYLGNGAYGVESAARTYFGKNCKDLTVAQAALLAGLVRRPAENAPTRNMKKALAKRASVLETMLKHNLITPVQFKLANAEQVVLREKLPNPYEQAPYFTEAVRRYIVEKYGENSLYHEGLKVWTTCNLAFQKRASADLLKGARAWEKRRRRPPGLIRKLGKREIGKFLAVPRKKPYRQGELVQAVVLRNNTPKPKRRRRKKEAVREQECMLALAGNLRFMVRLQGKVRYRPGDLLEFRVVSVDGTKLNLEHQTIPPIQGAVVCIENRTGYVRVLVGGLDFQRSRFNRAYQALRQPGSAFKPIVYSAALEWSQYGPFTTILDEPIAVVVDPRESEWIPMNSDMNFAGPITLTQALVYSRNTATVKVLMDVGIDKVIRMARNLGVRSHLGHNLSISLGASEVTPLELTAAYTVFPNMGMKVHPVLVKKVVDRFGNVLEDNVTEPVRVDEQALTTPSATAWLEQQRSRPAPQPDEWGRYPREETFRSQEDRARFTDAMRRPPVTREEASLSPRIQALLAVPAGLTMRKILRRPEPSRVLSPQTSYLMLSILREICKSGTAAKVSRLRRRDLAGKTGTTNDCTDSWFIGFNSDYTTGVWMGYDAKVSLGRKEYGSRAALPVWMDFMKEMKEAPGYPPPPGIVFYRDDGNPPPARGRLQALLESNPAITPDIPVKQVCPVDMGIVSVAGYASPYGAAVPSGPANGWGAYGPRGYAASAYGGYGYAGTPGMIRVLSPSGETLGHAPYSVDEKGKVMVFRDSFQPSYESTAEPYSAPSGGEFKEETRHPRSGTYESIIPRAARFLRNLQQSLPRGFGFEWSR